MVKQRIGLLMDIGREQLELHVDCTQVLSILTVGSIQAMLMSLIRGAMAEIASASRVMRLLASTLRSSTDRAEICDCFMKELVGSCMQRLMLSPLCFHANCGTLPSRRRRKEGGGLYRNMDTSFLQTENYTQRIYFTGIVFNLEFGSQTLSK